jgi:F420-non-reducing hydrogenase iron-sulfur subunit
MVDFNPTIIGFACNWCCYAGADLAGTSRMKYPANLRIIRVMCSGRIDPQFLLKGLLGGLGIEPERLELNWVSASEGQRFADAVTTFTDRIRQLGPLAISEPVAAAH